MHRFFVFTFVLLAVSIQTGFSQINDLGNIYQTFRNLSNSDSDKELKALQKGIAVEVRQNKQKSDEILQELRNRGYSFHIWSGVTNKNLKTLLVIDDRLVAMQSEIDSKISNLEGSYLIDSMSNNVNHARYYGSKEDKDYRFFNVLNEFSKRLSKLREFYSKYSNPCSKETNSSYLKQILSFNKSDDEGNLKILAQSLANRKQLYVQSLIVIAEHKRKQEEYQRLENEARLAEQERIRIDTEKAQEYKRKLEAEIATLPSKSAIKAKFRTYKHKTGHVFEMFPANFTPKQNKSTYDKVRVFGKTYTARYREYNDYGINSLIIEFYDTGGISNVTVSNGPDLMYFAKYRNGSNKPFEIMTKSADRKFHITFKRIYDIYEDKVNETFSYYYAPLDYYYD